MGALYHAKHVGVFRSMLHKHLLSGGRPCTTSISNGRRFRKDVNSMMDQEKKKSAEQVMQIFAQLPSEVQQAVLLFTLGADAASRAARETA